MRAMLFSVAAATALAGCGNASDKAEETAATANYRPPSVTSRLDYGGVIERRFHRIDANRDDRLQPAEIPPRYRGAVFEKWDADRNGTLDSDEWGKMMLDRFDRDDLNGDGTVTSEERALARSRERGN